MPSELVSHALTRGVTTGASKPTPLPPVLTMAAELPPRTPPKSMAVAQEGPWTLRCRAVVTDLDRPGHAQAGSLGLLVSRQALREAKGKKNAGPLPGIAVKNGGMRVAQLVNDKRPHEQKLRELYLIAVAREPSAEKRAALLAHIERRADDLHGAYAAILWAIVNTKEFQYNH